MTRGLVVRRLRPSDYAGMEGAFAELSARALEPNPHMAPAALAAALALVPEGEIVLLSTWLSEALGSERLAGIWALRRRRDWRSGFSAVLVSPLLPLYEVSSLPVLERDHAGEALAAMLRHVVASADLPNILALPLLPLEGASFRLLETAAAALKGRLSTYERWRRPVMQPRPGDDAESYLRRALGQSYKKRMQQFRTIARQGEAVFRRHRREQAAAAFEDFLALEAAGWKGEAGTAIARIPADAAYFRDLVARFAARDAVQVDALVLDGAPLAMGVLIESAGTRVFLKIAYDESRARLSPGRALTIAMLQADFAGTPAAFFDSGAGDGVDAGSYVWGERREMAHALLRFGSRLPGPPEWAAGLRQKLRRLRDRRAGETPRTAS